MKNKIKEVAELIKSKNNILILTHKNPDGDAIGSSFALYYSILKLGKNVDIKFDADIPNGYKILCGKFCNKNFNPDFIISVDLADTNLLSENCKLFETTIDLSIDHHLSNTNYAKKTLLDYLSASTTQLLYFLIKKIYDSQVMDSDIATCLYLGLATDTGCFKYSNTTALTHRVAADLIELGARKDDVNKLIFETKSKNKIQIEQKVLSNIEYYFDNKCSLIYITRKMIDESGVDDYELEGISALPIQIEGVEIGVTIKEKIGGGCKVSIRTGRNYSASDICKQLGGGGHKRAGGCSLDCDLVKAKKIIIDVIKLAIEEMY